MTWQSVAVINPSKEWQYTPAILGNLFRIKHSSTSEFARDFRAVIAQAFDEPNKETFFDAKRLAFKTESEAFLFVQPGGLINRKLAILRLDSLPDDWTIEIEVLDGMSSSISLPIAISDVNGLADELNTKTDLSVVSELAVQVNDLEDELNTKADLSAIEGLTQQVIISTEPPSDPVVNQTLWWNPEEQIQWFWNGQYWLTTELFETTQSPPASLSGSGGNTSHASLDRYSIFLVEQIIGGQINLPHNAQNFWNFIIGFKRRSDGSAVEVIQASSFNHVSSFTYPVTPVTLPRNILITKSDYFIQYYFIRRVGSSGSLINGVNKMLYRYARV